MQEFEQRIAKLDAKLGIGVGAVKERAKIARLIEERTVQEIKDEKLKLKREKKKQGKKRGKFRAIK